MIHESFPPQGEVRPAHEGSQSRTGTEVAASDPAGSKTTKANLETVKSFLKIDQILDPDRNKPVNLPK